MKKLFPFIAITLFILFYNSCTKDRTPAPVDCIPTDTINTYTNSVKYIFDGYCAATDCHDAATASSGVRLDTYEDVIKAAKTDALFFCVIDWSCTPTMPQAPNIKLADSLINKIQLWKANCYAQ